MIHQILNHRLPIQDKCPFEGLNDKFSTEDYKVVRKLNHVSLTPVLNQHRPSSLGRILFIKEIQLIKCGGHLEVGIIPNNLYIVLSYLLVMVMGYRESINMTGDLSGGDVLITSFLLFTVFLFSNLVFFKKTILKEVSKDSGRIPTC